MDDYVAKPVRGKELHAVLDKLLQGAPRPAGSSAPQPAAAPPQPAEEAAPDGADILSRVNGDKALLKELRTLFLAEYPKLLTQLREAMNSRSAEPFWKAAHALKGMLANLGARDAASAASSLERIGHDGDLSGAGEAYAALEKEIDRFSRALTGLVEERAE
jgi:HPt (histidine-containing phosphotransfer) domain-containing protein